jgi:uncharacterized membrane protein YedE/YeeE
MIISPMDWAMGLLGGALIGLASALMLLGAGRIAGISGITGALASLRPANGWGDNLIFLAGLIGAPMLYATLVQAPDIAVSSSAPLLIVAGLLVGFGTRLGLGCTSGHGICGVARLSPRSLVATITFMAVAIITVAASRLIGGG